MVQSVEEIVKQHLASAKAVDKANRDPEEARAFLLRARIVEKTKRSKKHPFGVKLAKDLT